MRPQDVFGAAPDSFKASVALALHRIEVEEKPGRRISVRLAICIAFAVLLLAGVVYAAAVDWKLFDFYKNRYGVEISQEAQDAIQKNDVRRTFAVGDMIITLQEAVADGQYLYLSAKAETKEPGTAYIMGIDWPTDNISIAGKYDYDNPRSYLTAAMEDNKRLISLDIRSEVVGADGMSGSIDCVMQEDGSIHYMEAMEMPTDADSIEIILTAYFREWTVQEDPTASEFIHNEIRFTLPITPPSEQVTIDLKGIPFPGTAALMDSVRLTVTPLSCYYEIAYTVIALEDKLLTAHTRNVLDFQFEDEAGEAFPIGLTMSGGKMSDDDVHYVQSSSIRIAELPKTLTLRPSESWGAKPDEALTLTIPGK